MSGYRWKGFGPLIPIAPDARKGKPPCGECHLHPGETCDICGAEEPALAGQAEPKGDAS